MTLWRAGSSLGARLSPSTALEVLPLQLTRHKLTRLALGCAAWLLPIPFAGTVKQRGDAVSAALPLLIS